MSTPTTPQGSSGELKAEVLRSRAELAAAIDELTTRLSPGYQASRLAQEAKQAAGDAKAMLTGDKNGPAQSPRRARNAKILLGATVGLVALSAAVVTTVALRRARG